MDRKQGECAFPKEKWPERGLTASREMLATGRCHVAFASLHTCAWRRGSDLGWIGKLIAELQIQLSGTVLT